MTVGPKHYVSPAGLPTGSTTTGLTIATNPSRLHAPEGGVAVRATYKGTKGASVGLRRQSTWDRCRGNHGELASRVNQLGIGAVEIMESKGVGREEGGCWKLEGWNMNPLPCLQLRLITLLQVG